MHPATRPLSIDADARARNGGTSTPAGSSVWDIDPGAREHPATSQTGETTEPAEADGPADSDRQTSGGSTDMVSPSTIRGGAAAETGIFTIASERSPRRGPRDLFAETPLSDVMLPTTTSPSVLAALEPERASSTAEAEHTGVDDDAVPPSTVAGIDRRLLLLLVLVIVLAIAAWILTRPGSTDLLAGDDVEIDTPGQFESDEPGQAVSPPPVAPDPAEEPVDAGAEIVVAEPSGQSSGDAAPAPTGVDPGSAAPPVAPPSPTVPDDEGITTPETVVAEPSVDAADVVEEPAEPPTAVTVAPATDAADDQVAAPADDGRRIEIDTEIGPCPFGSACLRAGFEVVGFDTLPDIFVCEFANGTRYTFDLPDRTVEYACATGSRGSSITIEVDGVRSATVVFD